MSGYHLHQGTSLAVFPRKYSELFLAEHPLSPPVYIVVQNAGLGEWLSRSLAGSLGGVMGQRILLPEQALRFFTGGYSSARRLLSRDGGDRETGPDSANRGADRGLLFMDGLKLVVYKVLEEVLAGEDSLYASLRDYAPDGGTRLWQLADALAGIYYHYGMNCLPLVDAWDAGRSYPGLTDAQRTAEDWQRGLWRRIFHPDAPYTHLSRVLSETMAAGESYDGPHARVILFGSMFLGETGLQFFRHLSESLEVHHFIFTPSELFSGSRSPTLPFLENNARLSADFASLIPLLRPDSISWHHESDDSRVTLLHRIRDGLARDALPADSEEPGEGTKTDGSLQIHDAVGARRQVEVLKDRILDALRGDESLAPTDIGVLAPDISAYAALIESVFAEGGRGEEALPFNLSDLPSRSELPYPAGFAALRDLPGGRFGRSSLFSLFENPCFTPCAGDARLVETWRRLMDSTGIRWGVNPEHRRDSGAADPRTGSWERGFVRLLGGYCLDEGDRPDFLPVDPGGDSGAEDAGRLMRTLRHLDADLRTLDSEKHSLKDWTLRWERIIDLWLRPRREEGREEDESDRMRIKGAIRDLMALDDDLDGLSDFNHPELPWSAFSALLDEAVSSAGARKGRYLARGVTCASLKPMRAIPFRRIYVLGMEEGAWPGRDYLTGFDLRDSVEKYIDLSREAVDRYAFLETLFSASEHISFFYSGRDAERGDSISPAAPLAELCEYARPGNEIPVFRHPLVPWDSAALGGTPHLGTFSTEALDLARSLREGPAIRPSDEFGTVVPETESTLEWTELLRFLKDPIRSFFLSRGVRLRTMEEDADEEDILEASFLDWWSWRSGAVENEPSLLERPELLVESFSRQMALEGAVSDTPLGHLGDSRRMSDAEAMAGQYRRLCREGLSMSEPFSVLLDPACAIDTAGALREARDSRGTFRLPSPRFTADDGTTVFITGRIDGLRFLEQDGTVNPEIWTRLSFVSGHQLKAGNLLEGWLSALLLGAVSGSGGPAGLRVYHLGGRDFPARRYSYRPEDEESGEGGERRSLEQPGRLLSRLLKIRELGLSSPLVLHPELADRLKQRESRGESPAGDSLATDALRCWKAILADERSRSKLRDSPYLQLLPSEPDTRSAVFEMAWTELYRDGGIL